MNGGETGGYGGAEDWAHGGKFHGGHSNVFSAWENLVDNSAGHFKKGELCDTLEVVPLEAEGCFGFFLGL